MQCERSRFSPGSGRSPGERDGCPCQYCCLENSMDIGAWQASAHGVPKSQTQWETNTIMHHWLLTLGEADVKCDLKIWTYLPITQCIEWYYHSHCRLGRDIDKGHSLICEWRRIKWSCLIWNPYSWACFRTASQLTVVSKKLKSCESWFAFFKM